MTPAETGRVLAKLAAFDQRTVGAADIAAWHEVIGHLDPASCIRAVTAHYRENSHRAMPSEIRKLATELRVQERAAQSRRDRVIDAAPTPATGGKALCAFILMSLRRAGQDPWNGRFLGKDRAGDVAEAAARKWLSTPPEQRAALAEAGHQPQEQR